jgi:hypothetical protein
MKNVNADIDAKEVFAALGVTDTHQIMLREVLTMKKMRTYSSETIRRDAYMYMLFGFWETRLLTKESRNV